MRARRAPGRSTSFKQGSSVTGMSFYTTGDYGAAVRGRAVLRRLHARLHLVHGRNEDGPGPDEGDGVRASRPDFPIDLERGPGGDLFYVDIVDGDVQRIQKSTLSRLADGRQDATARRRSPCQLTATVTGQPGRASPTPGISTATGSTATAAQTGATVAEELRQADARREGPRARHRRRRPAQVTTSKPVLIAAGDAHPPVAHIDTPSPALTWTVGQKIDFSGGGTDPDEPGGATDQARTSWELILQHCPGGCHQHYVRSYAGVGSGSFTGLQHEYPSRPDAAPDRQGRVRADRHDVDRPQPADGQAQRAVRPRRPVRRGQPRERRDAGHRDAHEGRDRDRGDAADPGAGREDLHVHRLVGRG